MQTTLEQDFAAEIGNQINLAQLFDMLVTFFKARTADKDKLMRRLPVAVRLHDGEEYIFTIRPGWQTPHFQQYDYTNCERVEVNVQHYGKFKYERLFVDAIGATQGKCCKFHFNAETMKLSSWYHKRYEAALY